MRLKQYDKAAIRLRTKLLNACDNYCGQLTNENVMTRKRIKKKKVNRRQGRKKKEEYYTVWDTPCVASVCYTKKYAEITKKSYSRDMTSCNPELKSRLDRFGELGQTPFLNELAANHSPNKLGRCAEHHSASDVLNAANGDGVHPKSIANARAKGTKIDDLIFSPALRVKTRQIIDECENCSVIFEKSLFL